MGWGQEIFENPKLRAWVRSGRPFKPWDNRPQIPVYLSWIWEAFQELQTTRPSLGFGGSGRIPWNAINDYCSSKQIRDAGRFERLIRRMDQEHLRLLSERKDDEDGGE